MEKVYVSVLVILIVATIVVGVMHVSGTSTAESLLGSGDESRIDTDITGSSDVDVETAADGTKYIVHPSELRQGCPSMDCIPSIDDPSFVSADAADAWLDPNDVVLGVELNGETKAYPLRIMERHEIVNDVVGGEPVAVTYCPLCRSGVVHSRELENQTLTFGVSGKLRNANLVMYDRQTETYWSQIGGRAIIGPLVPAELDLLPTAVVRWKNWRSGHPDTSVLSRNTGIYPASSYDELLYERYHSRPSVGFGVDEPSGELAAKEIVHGVNVNDTSRAYPEAVVEREQVINDKVGETPVVLVVSPEDGAVTAFKRSIDDTTLRFELQDNRLVDQEGRSWKMDGEALESSLEGRKLERVRTDAFYWFAWEKFNTNTTIYRGG